LTVASEITSSAAISALESPRPISFSTFSSRSLSSSSLESSAGDLALIGLLARSGGSRRPGELRGAQVNSS
jgi:hypothetical protein